MNNNDKTKYIFVTGGVLSGLGKGVSAASLGRLLKSRGFKVFVQKFDPYYNVDPGTMSPYQHGEVYVTVDGGETDLDLGHYERFIDERFSKKSNYVQGKLLKELLDEERKGKYGGNTIQVIPHVTDKIISKIEETMKLDEVPDFVITEIGGTVGDIESLPFISAISQFSRKHKNSSFFIHTTFIPYLEASKEFKSKPTQNSLSTMQSQGIIPNMLLLRANKEIHNDVVEKIALKAYLPKESCIPVPNVDNIYKIPLHFEKYNMADRVLEFFGMNKVKPNLNKWKEYIKLIDSDKKGKVNITLAGKYIEFEDAYKSIVEALKISCTWKKVSLNIKWLQTEKVTDNNVKDLLKGSDGVIILPGFGKRGFEGKVEIAKFTRNHDIPTFGICYGMQAMVIDQALRVGIEKPSSSEVHSSGNFVIDIIRGKNHTENIGGTLRLGLSETKMVKGSIIQKIYKTPNSFERHRHRYEVNPEYVERLQDEEFIFSGFDSKNNLAEVCEVKNKKFFIGLQAHPEFNATPLNPHPVFNAFIESLIK